MINLERFSPRPDNFEVTRAVERIDLSRVPMIIPVGGLGLRAREVTRDLIPKHLIQLSKDLTILDLVCIKLQEVGFREFVFCVAYRKDQILEHLSQQKWVIDGDTRFDFLVDKKPLGPDGAIYQALRDRSYTNPVTIVPGDMFLPWESLEFINRFHSTSGADITIGLTSVTTERTTDIGRILVNQDTNKLLRCFGRDEAIGHVPENAIRLTSAGMFVVNPLEYISIYDAYNDENCLNGDKQISMRDDLLPWMEQKGGYVVKGFDLKGEVLDLGTPRNIHYGLENWTRYT